MVTLDEVSKKLDKELIEYMSLHVQLDAAMKRLEEKYRDGMISMSQARVSIGQRGLCSLQYNPTEEALCSVDVYIDPKECKASFQKYTDNKKEKSKPQTVAKSGGDTAILRNRKNVGEKDIKNEEDKKETTQKKQVDPIRWFGVLVPGSLRSSQTSFKAVIDMVLEVAEIRSQMQMRREAFLKLKEQKQKLRPSPT